MADAKPDPKELLHELIKVGDDLRDTAGSLIIGSVENAGSNSARLRLASSHWNGVRATNLPKLLTALEEKR